jgi:serine/threonine protein kinase
MLNNVSNHAFDMPEPPREGLTPVAWGGTSVVFQDPEDPTSNMFKVYRTEFGSCFQNEREVLENQTFAGMPGFPTLLSVDEGKQILELRYAGNEANIKTPTMSFGNVVLALKLAHAHNVVHRDVTPRNIFVDLDGNSVLGDWGSARNLGQNDDGVDSFVGTKAFAPWSIRQGLPYRKQDDLYELINCLIFLKERAGLGLPRSDEANEATWEEYWSNAAVPPFYCVLRQYADRLDYDSLRRWLVHDKDELLELFHRLNLQGGETEQTLDGNALECKASTHANKG